MYSLNNVWKGALLGWSEEPLLLPVTSSWSFHETHEGAGASGGEGGIVGFFSGAH